jgi:hypothetical protein
LGEKNVMSHISQYLCLPLDQAYPRALRQHLKALRAERATLSAAIAAAPQLAARLAEVCDEIKLLKRELRLVEGRDKPGCAKRVLAEIGTGLAVIAIAFSSDSFGAREDVL